MHCQWGSWDIGTCLGDCGTGRRTKTRTITRKSKYGGRQCNSEENHTSEACKLPNQCPGNDNCYQMNFLRLSQLNKSVIIYFLIL